MQLLLCLSRRDEAVARFERTAGIPTLPMLSRYDSNPIAFHNCGYCLDRHLLNTLMS